MPKTKILIFLNEFRIFFCTNAQSITPKIDSLIEYLGELDASLAFLTETWLSNSKELENDVEDLELGTGHSFLYKNRDSNTRGYAAGGVAIAFQKNNINLKIVKLPGKDFEIVFFRR